MKVIILAGGCGTRLWPLSRDNYPKPFIKLKGVKRSLFQETILRSLLLVDINDIIIVTNKNYKDLVVESFLELKSPIKESNIIIEPEAKNTLPAIYAAVHQITQIQNDTVIVFPSDHLVSKSQEFVEKIKLIESEIGDSIITFGITPSSPQVGYGYIAPSVKVSKHAYEVKEFKEKPKFEIAQKYIENGYFWNAGIFMFNTKTFINEVKQYEPDICLAFQNSKNIDDAFCNICNNISIDYGIIEKSKKILVVPVDIGWTDLGSFDSFFDVFKKDENNNIVKSESIVIDSYNNYIYSDTDKIISVIGADDLIIIDNKDALLICKRNQSQKVKQVVAEIKKKNSNYNLKK